MAWGVSWWMSLGGQLHDMFGLELCFKALFSICTIMLSTPYLSFLLLALSCFICLLIPTFNRSLLFDNSLQPVEMFPHQWFSYLSYEGPAKHSKWSVQLSVDSITKNVHFSKNVSTNKKSKHCISSSICMIISVQSNLSNALSNFLLNCKINVDMFY